MHGNALPPKFAADLASNVYLVKDDLSRRLFLAKYKNTFDMSQSKMSRGTTGALMIVKKSHIMAFMAVGQGQYKGQAFVAIKGTASLYDALTDLNTGLRSSHTGLAVHQGFYYAFDSIIADVRRFLSGINGISTVHCVGHSLGGALATLAADWIKSSGRVPTVKLYTFGSPRVGLQLFANACTSRLTPANIYRVHHKTDPVPLVPTWPFYHVPDNNADYLVDSPLSIRPWEYHLMKHYTKSAERAGSWQSMRTNRPKSHMASAVERWLKSDGVLSFTANTLDLLDAALLYVIKKIMHVAGITLVAGAATTFTLLDRMAMFMAKAVKISADLSIWVFRLVKKMASLIGIKIKEGADLTAAFIRRIFMRLHGKVSEMIRQAGRLIN